MFDSFVFLPLSTRAYSKGRAYIKIILKNHARSYFAGRSCYRGNTVSRGAGGKMSAAGHGGLSPRALSRTHAGKPISRNILHKTFYILRGKYIFPLAIKGQ